MTQSENESRVEAVQEREAQLREAQRIAGIGSWEWTVGSNDVTWSEGLHLILKRDIALGAPSFADLSDHYAPESWDRLGVAIGDAIENGTGYELELAMIRDDGETCWTTTRGEAVRGSDGKVTRLRGTVHDITERRRAEIAYQEREAQLREAQRIAGIGSWEWTVGSDEVAWSEGLHLILKRDLGLGAPTFANLSNHYTPDSWERLGVAIGESIEHGTPYEHELAMIRDDGEICWTTTRGEAIRDEHGNVVRLRGTVHDITERKRLQARTAQADRLSSMGLLAAGVAHEINNPLTYVLYNVESLAEDLPKVFAAARRAGDQDADDELRASTADVLERVQEAVEGSQRIKVLIRSLSTFSRVEKVEETQVNLQHAIDSAVNMARNELKFRARLVRTLGDVPTVWASEGKLSQVFLNLLINAAHAIEEGNVDQNVITIRTWTEGDDVFAEVEDTGKGIPDDDLERVFEPFFSRKQIGMGAGLGLAICRSIVTAFGGDIWVKSEVGRGSCFTIRLPTKRGVPEADREEPVRATAASGRILVVDDEPAIRNVLKRLLGRQYEVVTTDSGMAGRRVLQQDQSFDVILCDLMMPTMTGMELHEWLGSNMPDLAERVVFITGGIFTPRAAEYLASVHNPRVQKPFDTKALRVLIAELVEARRDAESRNDEFV